MGWLISEERIPVQGLPCQCPGTVHPDGDTVWLRKELTPDGALEVTATFGEPDLKAAMSWAFVLNGVVAWTFLDEQGKPLPCTREYIRLLKWDYIWIIAQAASDLGYTESLMRPLVATASTSSRNGQMTELTSAAKGSGGRSRKR